MTKRIISSVLAVFMVFTCVMTAVTVPSSAVSKPAKVSSIKAETTDNSIHLKWKKAKRAEAYEVFIGKKMVADVSEPEFDILRLKANTKYKMKIRAYRTYEAKQKQYWNSKSKKWVKKKPKKKYYKACSDENDSNYGKKTKTVYIEKVAYGAYSKVVTVKTQKEPTSYPTLQEARAQVPATLEAYIREESNRANVLEKLPYKTNEDLNKIAQQRAEMMYQHKQAIDTFKGDKVDGYEALMKNAGMTVPYDSREMFADKVTSFGFKHMIEDRVWHYTLPSNNTNLMIARPYTDIGVGYCNGYIDIIVARYE